MRFRDSARHRRKAASTVVYCESEPETLRAGTSEQGLGFAWRSRTEELVAAVVCHKEIKIAIIIDVPENNCRCVHSPGGDRRATRRGEGSRVVDPQLVGAVVEVRDEQVGVTCRQAE